jgi:hypothetical protein
LRAHVVNDTEEPVICAPGSKRDSLAFLEPGCELQCEPHAEAGFVFSVPRYSTRSAFVRVSGKTFACGFEKPLADERKATAIAVVAVAAVVAGIAVGIVLYERKRRRKPSVTPSTSPGTEPSYEPAPSPQAAEATRVVHPPKLVEPVVEEPAQAAQGLQARGFAAVLDHENAVMAALECERQNFASSDFIARIVNHTPEPLHCAISARTRRGSVSMLPGAFSIHPESTAEVNVTAPVRFPRLRTLYLRMQNSSVSASAQAEVPVAPLLRIMTVVATVIVAVAIAAAIFLLARPRVVGLALPSNVLAGAPVTGSYSVAGIGSANYRVTFRRRVIARGALSSRSGSFTFPTAPRPGRYLVTLEISGPFGTAGQSLAFSSTTHPVAATASIASLGVDPGVAAAGASVRVRYAAQADSGTISLIDISGITLQSVPYRVNGVSTLSAPPVDTPTQYQVALDVTRGQSHAHASVGLLVLPKPLPAPPVTPTAASGMLKVLQLMRITPGYVVSARPFVVHLLAHPGNLRLTLQNESGIAVFAETVPPNASTVQMRAPYVTADQPFELVASFTRGSLDQVLLDQIEVHAY